MPLYQTPDQLAREDATSAKVAEFLGLEERKRPDGQDRVDRDILWKGQRIAVMEIRHRNNESTKYDGVYGVDLAKIEALRQREVELWVPAFLVVQWTDRLGMARVRREMTLKTSMNERKDRNDPYDRDLWTYFPAGWLVHPSEMTGWIPIAIDAVKQKGPGSPPGPLASTLRPP